MPNLEKSFSDFLERREYDEAEAALFSMVRISYIAGWLAAGGKPPQSQKIVELVQPMRMISLEETRDGIDTILPDEK